MSAADRDALRAVQERLLHAITARPGPELQPEPESEPEAEHGGETLVRGGGRLTPADRLAIYRRMYFARLREALADDYPGVLALVGDAAFDELARGYVDAHPPASFTLADLGGAFPAYLRARRGDVDVAGNLAELEWAIARAFTAEDEPPLTAAALAAVAPEAFAGARLRLSPAVSLVVAEHPVCRILDAIQEGEPPPLQPEKSHVRVWRRELVVWREPIPRAAFELLTALQGGALVADAMERAAAAWDGDDAALAEEVFAWFGAWVGEEMFSAIDLG